MSEDTIQDFNISEEMLEIIGKEFDVEALVDKFASAVKGKESRATEDAAREIFGAYGHNLALRSLELGDKYSDATYEAIKTVVAKLEYLYWPIVPQRFVEIAYLSVMPIQSRNLNILQNNGEKLKYALSAADCGIYHEVAGKCGEKIADSLPCRYACNACFETILEGLKIDGYAVTIEETIAKNGRCVFSASRP